MQVGVEGRVAAFVQMNTEGQSVLSHAISKVLRPFIDFLFLGQVTAAIRTPINVKCNSYTVFNG